MLQFKDRIKKLRKEKDMTQEQLAEYMGVSPQAVSRWETGTTCPDIFALPALAELFGFTVDGLLGVDEKEKQKLLSSEQKHILELDDVVKAYDMVKE